MHARFKLSAGSQRRDEQDPINVGVIVGLSGAYQARNASQSPPFELFCDATKVEKQLPTRTAKSDDALTKNNLVAYFRNRRVFSRDQNFLTGIAAHADGIHTKPESRLDNSYIHREESDLAIRLAGGAV